MNNLRLIRILLDAEFPPLSDEELVLSAEEVFLELDCREAEEQSPSLLSLGTKA